MTAGPAGQWDGDDAVAAALAAIEALLAEEGAAGRPNASGRWRRESQHWLRQPTRWRSFAHGNPRDGGTL
jgi:hypothetical protein